MRFQTYFVGTILLLAFSLSVVRSRAQEVTVAPSVLELTTQSYFAAVEKYRSDEQKFVIARETYYQLNTLASQDEAIRRAKDVMLSRAELLNTYFTYLHLTLLQTRGVEITDKERILNQIASILADLAVYKDRIPVLDSRAEVDRHLVLLNEQQRSYFTAAYGALEVTKIGELQTAIDSASRLRQDLTGWVEAANISAADRAIKQRGLAETDRLLEQAQADLAGILLDQRRESAGQITAQSYRAFQGKVDPVYVELRQAESFLKEIAKGL